MSAWMLDGGGGERATHRRREKEEAHGRERRTAAENSVGNSCARYYARSCECTCQWSSFNSFIDPRINWDAVILTLATRRADRARSAAALRVRPAPVAAGRLGHETDRHCSTGAGVNETR